MTFAKQKLLTLLSILLLTLFVGCTNQPSQQPPAEPEATVRSDELLPTVRRDLATLDDSPITEAQIRRLFSEVISPDYTPYSMEYDLNEVDARLAPLGLKMVETPLDTDALISTTYTGNASSENALTTQQVKKKQCKKRTKKPKKLDNDFVDVSGELITLNLDIGGDVYSDDYMLDKFGRPSMATIIIDRNRIKANVSGVDNEVIVGCKTSSVGALGNEERGVEGVYQGGHMAAARFGGPSIRENLYPQVGTFNMGSFRATEDNIAKCALSTRDLDIKYKVTLNYRNQVTNIPDSITVELTTNPSNGFGKRFAKKSWTFDNQYSRANTPTARALNAQTRASNNEIKNEIKKWLNNEVAGTGEDCAGPSGSR